MPEKTGTRMAWLDVLKLMAVMFVYIGHRGTSVGRWYDFVWFFEVPLLFFCSGVVHKDTDSVWPFVRKKACGLLVPYLFFLALQFARIVLTERPSANELLRFLIFGTLGFKQFPYVDFLWFLPALFSLSVVAWLMHRAIRNEPVRLLACLVISCLSGLYLDSRVDLPLSANRALTFLVYYEGGFFLHRVYRGRVRTAFRWGGWIFLAHALVVYRRGTALITGLPFAPLSYVAGELEVFSLILGMVYVAKAIQPCTILARAGRETLFLYGNEALVKIVYDYICVMLGLPGAVNGEWIALINTALMIVLVLKWFIPLEKPVLQGLTDRAGRLLTRCGDAAGEIGARMTRERRKDK